MRYTTVTAEDRDQALEAAIRAVEVDHLNRQRDRARIEASGGDISQVDAELAALEDHHSALLEERKKSGSRG